MSELNTDFYIQAANVVQAAVRSAPNDLYFRSHKGYMGRTMVDEAVEYATEHYDEDNATRTTEVTSIRSRTHDGPDVAEHELVIASSIIKTSNGAEDRVSRGARYNFNGLDRTPTEARVRVVRRRKQPDESVKETVKVYDRPDQVLRLTAAMARHATTHLAQPRSR